MACETYEFRIGQESRRREGGFWADFLNFRRTTEVTGWRFEALVVVRGGVVLFRIGAENRASRARNCSATRWVRCSPRAREPAR